MSTDNPPNRIERRKQEFRDRIVKAALKLIIKNGVHDTSVASIIREADIAHKTFFNHFPSKDHLMAHITEAFSDRAYGLFRNEFSTITEPKKRIEFCMMIIAETLKDLHPNYRELMNIYLLGGAGHHDLVYAEEEAFTQIISEVLKDAKKQKILKADCSLETYTEMVVGICVVVLRNWSLDSDYPLMKKMKNATQFINASLFTS